MSKHVAVLRGIGHELRQKCRSKGKDCEICATLQSSLDHAIATCEQHAALVARLDGALRELHLVYQSIGNDAMAEGTMRRINDLARVVKPEGGGDGR